MADKLTVNGVSTTKTDEFRCEEFRSSVTNNKYVQWDYRDKAGVLHSGVAPTLEIAMSRASEFGFSM